MSPSRIAGIMGGMGPEATVDLYDRIVGATVRRGATRDQDHPEVVISSVPETPDRTEAIEGGDRSIIPYLERSARRLEAAGAGFIAIACCSAHHFLADIRAAVSIPVLDMIALTVEAVARDHPEVEKVGLLATTGTIRAGLYQSAARAAGFEVIVPGDDDQSGLVMESVYGTSGIKSGGDRSAARKRLLQAATGLAGAGAGVIVAGCTEISLVLRGQSTPLPLVDPTEVLAQAIVDRALSR